MQCVRRHELGLALILGLVIGTSARGAEGPPCVSGLRPGQRPGPYAAVVVTGEHRGQSHCFICETADRPAVIVFARGRSEPLGKLVAGLDRALLQQKSTDLRAWVTFLGEDESSLAPKILDWSKQHAVRGVPLAVFEDPEGPPSYRISRIADVTVLLSVRQKVVRNFAFRAGELTGERVAEILDCLPAIAPPARK
jgi:hypothetical protein